MERSLILLILMVALETQQQQRSENVICYWQGLIEASQIDPKICTHLIFTFLGVDENGNLNFLYTSENEGKRRLTSLRRLKNKNESLKILAAVGGADSQQTQSISKFIKFQKSRVNFIRNVVKIIQEFELSGIDIDYEYPQTNEDTLNFAQLLDEINDSFAFYGFILSIAVAPDKWRADKFYDIQRVAKSVDIINLMTYDFHGRWSEKIGHHAQMYPHRLDSSYMKELNCASVVSYWISKGVPAKKLHLGIPTYGNIFILDDLRRHRIGDDVNRTMTMNLGFPIGFNDFCEQKKGRKWEQFFDTNYRAFYAVNEAERKWIGFDHPRQVAIKAKFIKDMKLGGAVFWSVDTDDFKNFCNYGNFSMISSMHATLFNKI